MVTIQIDTNGNWKLSADEIKRIERKEEGTFLNDKQISKTTSLLLDLEMANLLLSMAPSIARIELILTDERKKEC